MENYNQKSNIDCDYDLVYLIQKSNKIVAMYDNYDIAFVKFINLIYNDIEIISRLKLDEKFSDKIKKELNEYNMITLIKNSDIKINNIKLCMKDFALKDNTNIIDINFIEKKIRYYILNKILEIKHIYHYLSLDNFKTTNNLIEEDLSKKQNIVDSDNQKQELSQSDNTQEQSKDFLLEKIDKLQSIKTLQEDIVLTNKEKEKEKEEYIKKVLESKKELEAKIKELKQKKEKLKEQKNIYEADLKIYNVVKKNLNDDENFKIPELFIRKFEIFSLMDEKKNISFEEYLKYNPFKLNIKITGDYNQIFESSNEDNIAYLSDESEYSDSSNSEASSQCNEIEMTN